MGGWLGCAVEQLFWRDGNPDSHLLLLEVGLHGFEVAVAGLAHVLLLQPLPLPQQRLGRLRMVQGGGKGLGLAICVSEAGRRMAAG